MDEPSTESSSADHRTRGAAEHLAREFDGTSTPTTVTRVLNDSNPELVPTAAA